MEFSLSEEQQLLQNSIEKFMARSYDFEQRQRLVESEVGYSPGHWKLFAEQGWLGMPFCESDGGYGGKAVDIMVVMQALGKGLVVEPYLANTVLCGGMIAKLGGVDQKEQYIPDIMEGQKQFALAYAEKNSRYNNHFVESVATENAEGFLLSGQKITVLNGPAADLILVTSRTSGKVDDYDGISVFIVNARAEGLTRRDYTTVDGFRASEITFDNVQLYKDALLGTADVAASALDSVMLYAGLAACAEAVGIMETVLQKTVEFARTREQFGVPIGKFQALQHRMADMFMECEQSRSMLYMAAIELDRKAENKDALLSGAKYRIMEAARFVGQQSVQIHGGMGITDELDIGHYFKRLTVLMTLFGDSDYHLARYMTQIA